MTETTGVSFRANVSGIRSATSGGWKITLDIFEADDETAAELVKYLKANVQIGMVRLPE